MGRWGGFEERVLGAGRGVVAAVNGLVLAVASAGEENGLAFSLEEEENGFGLPLVFGVAFVPKMLSPMFCCVVLVLCASLSVWSLPLALDLGVSWMGLTRTPRKPLMLPCFR